MSTSIEGSGSGMLPSMSSPSGHQGVVKEAVELFETQLKRELPLKDFSQIEDDSRIWEIGKKMRGEVILKFLKEVNVKKNIGNDLNEMASQMETKIEELVSRNERFRHELRIFIQGRASFVSSGFKTLAQSLKNRGIMRDELVDTLEKLKKEEVSAFGQYLRNLIPEKEEFQMEERNKLEFMLDTVRDEVSAVEVVDPENANANTGQIVRGSAEGSSSLNDLKLIKRSSEGTEETLAAGHFMGNDNGNGWLVGDGSVVGDSMNLEEMPILEPITDPVNNSEEDFFSKDEQSLPPNPGGLQRVAALKCSRALSESVNKYCEPGENEKHPEWNGNDGKPVRKKRRSKQNTAQLFKCPHCEKAYTSKSNMTLHKLTKHN